LFNICHCDSGLAFTSKNYYIASQNCVYFIRENSPNSHQKHKWALWMSNLGFYVHNLLNFLLRISLDVGCPLNPFIELNDIFCAIYMSPALIIINLLQFNCQTSLIFDVKITKFNHEVH
jgi:hypothetical protein